MEEKEINLLDYWNIIWKHKKFIIISVTVVTLLALIISLILPKWYRATAVIMPPAEEESGLGAIAGKKLGGGLGGMLGGNESQMRLLTILKSKSVLKALDEEFDLQNKWNKKFKFQTYEKIKSNLNINLGEESQINISMLDKDQDQVADMVNHVVHCLDSLNIAMSTSKGKSNRIFIENRMRTVRDSLTAVENRISDFMENNSIIAMEGQLTAQVEKAADMKAEIMAKEVELSVMKTRTTSSRAIANAEVDLKILKDKYDELFQNSGSAGAFINLDDVPDIQKKYSRLKRNAVYFTKVLEYLGPQYEQAKIQEMKDVPTIQVIDRATRPEWKIKPKRAYIVILAMIASFLITNFLVLFSAFIKYAKNN
ncbi:MAG: Wzz/FepE/Etk N-terminal domain-containing protein [Candidatus Krumholzibacteriota bacterium]|nr:Wzz/FepE/Etk N-terminal domain-containing protein [Candidatus Krumholzibacteriota bacterium]